MIGIAVVGCGYWGPNIARNFAALEGVELRALCDLDPARLAALHRHHRQAFATTSFEEVLARPDVDAVAVCTPVATHHVLAGAALSAGKHVLVEKPLTGSVADGRPLVERAESRGLVLQVDHTFVYSGAVRRIAEIVASGELGDLLYIDSVRINLGLFQSDVNVVWDLAAHDVSIVMHLLGREPSWVSAIGRAHYGPHESQAYLTLAFPNSVIAHLHVNWLAPVKLRSTLIGGSKRMIVYNDLDPSEKIRIYDKGVTLSSDPEGRARALVDYRMGDMFAPHVDKTEPLAGVCTGFVEAIESGTQTLSDGREGLAVVRVLEAAQESIRREGERVDLDRLP